MCWTPLPCGARPEGFASPCEAKATQCDRAGDGVTLLLSGTLFSSQKINSWPSILPDTRVLSLKKFYWSIVASLKAQLVKDPPAMQEIPA